MPYTQNFPVIASAGRSALCTSLRTSLLVHQRFGVGSFQPNFTEKTRSVFASLLVVATEIFASCHSFTTPVFQPHFFFFFFTLYIVLGIILDRLVDYQDWDF
jgi:hypothetical protein